VRCIVKIRIVTVVVSEDVVNGLLVRLHFFRRKNVVAVVRIGLLD